jgi:L,D-transpeptidase YcbB
MRIIDHLSYSAISLTCLLVLVACNNNPKADDSISKNADDLQKKTKEIISSSLQQAINNNGRLEDSAIILRQPGIINTIYEKKDFVPIWSANKKWIPDGDSLFQFIQSAKFFGLFPEDYFVKELSLIRKKFLNDSTAKTHRKDASLWAKADILLTNAFINIIKDVKLGRLPNDSVTLRTDSVLKEEFYHQQLEKLQQTGSISEVIHSLEPDILGYKLLKRGIQKFLDSSDYREFTKVPAPSKGMAQFKKSLQKRLFEEGYLSNDSTIADSVQLSEAVKKFQLKKGIAVDGKVGDGTLRMMNSNDRDKFVDIAISLDQYKMMPEKMPEKYICVNIPSYKLQLIEGDSVRITSKVIVGKRITRTPVLSSAISTLITYPQWVPPPSIIMKEILPAVKKNPAYLGKKGFSLLDSKGEEVDPFTVDWAQYSKGIPYRVVQGSGDANSLGILKFVFNNKYSVYLHDTNQRYLFGQTMRSLSHGCVRVQDWEKLAYYIIKNDSKNSENRYQLRADSVKTWLQKKQKRNIAISERMPLFIRYITCEGNDNGVVFYDDIYGDFKKIKEKYFAGK